MRREKANISHEERLLFRQSVEKGIPNVSVKQKVVASSDSNAIPFPQESKVILHRIKPNDWVSAEDRIDFAINGVSQRIRNKLRRGQIPCEASLDLHQLTGNQALEAIRNFLQQCLIAKKRCVLIIHGKGTGGNYPGPVLKNLVNRWLRELPQVMAVGSGSLRHGGTGAVYVLLKSSV